LTGKRKQRSHQWISAYGDLSTIPTESILLARALFRANPILTTRAVAERLGIKEGTLSAIRKGETYPDLVPPADYPIPPACADLLAAHPHLKISGARMLAIRDAWKISANRKRLTALQQEVCTRVLGLSQRPAEKMADIARESGCSCEAVRQLLRSGLSRLLGEPASR